LEEAEAAKHLKAGLQESEHGGGDYTKKQFNDMDFFDLL